uniref:Uncharacterized protein n=1 Tax=Pseudictyota dubia TaxID=2749911 RepID=A0A7R9WEC4_9STRA|mmetsp:Transcript_4685/g.8149  ORF Transcript_4685/g.8149 Transcript_4685/m.8149 type:complete len:215 (+) Transcript_4685:648-1292(+)
MPKIMPLPFLLWKIETEAPHYIVMMTQSMSPMRAAMKILASQCAGNEETPENTKETASTASSDAIDTPRDNNNANNSPSNNTTGDIPSSNAFEHENNTAASHNEDEPTDVSAGDRDAAEASTDTIALLEATSELVPKIIDDVDKLVQELVEKRKRPEEWIARRIFGDAFHVMDRVKVPIHHTAKAAYFRALREAMFLMDATDVRKVKEVLRKKG